MYEPLVPAATVKDPERAPPATVQSALDARPVGVDEIVQLVSPAEKLEPTTRTLVPGRPEEGIRETAGVTSNVLLVTVLPLPVVVIVTPV